jgi:hypothetical protein
VKPTNPKECVLIFDHETGEITLEALASQVSISETVFVRVDRFLLVKHTKTTTKYAK